MENLQEIKGIIEQINTATISLRATFDEKFNTQGAEWQAKMDKIQNHIDLLEAQLKGRKTGFDGALDAITVEAEKKMAVFGQFLRKGVLGLGPESIKMLSSATDAEGGYSVPDDFRNEVIRKMKNLVVIRSLARVINTNSDTVLIPSVETEGAAAWTGQSATAGDQTYSAQDVTWGNRVLNPKKMTRITLVSEELLSDTAIGLEALLSDIFAQAFAELEDSGFIAGTGTGNQPTGLLTDSAMTYQDTATTATFVADDMITLLYTLKPQYRQKGVFVMASGIERAVRLFKDTTNQYIWQPSYQADKPNTILGRPVYNQDISMVSTLTTGSKVVIFGDFSNFWIADRWDMTMQRLNEKYADAGKVGFLARKRTDGKIALGEAFKTLRIK